MPPEVNPRLVFERLFGPAEASDDPATRAKRQRYEKSILDFVREDYEEAEGGVGTDRPPNVARRERHPPSTDPVGSRSTTRSMCG